MFAWYAPENIPLLLLDDGIAPEAERVAALAALTSVSLLTPSPETTSGPTVTLHRLVQAVMRHRLAAQDAAEATRDAAVARLSALFPSGAYRNPVNWPQCRALLPHVRVLVERLGFSYETLELAELLSSVDNFLDGSGDTASAVALSRRCLEIRERVLGKSIPIRSPA